MGLFKLLKVYHLNILDRAAPIGYELNSRSSKATSMVVGKFVVVKGEGKLSKLIGIYRVGRVVGAHVILKKYAESTIYYIEVKSNE